MKFLVFPEAALRNGIRTSEHFPRIVEAEAHTRSEDILELCFDRPFRPGYDKTYIIIPICSSFHGVYRPRKVTFHPIRNYEVHEETFNGV